MFDQFITAETIQEFSTIIMLITIITQVFKNYLKGEFYDVKDSTIRLISFFVGFTISITILLVFKVDVISIQNIVLVFFNSIIMSISANGLYDMLNTKIHKGD